MQQQTNFFTPTQKHLIQLHGFPNITDIIYVKPLYSVRSLVVYPSLRPDSVPELIKEYQKHNPDLRLEVIVNKSSAIEQHILDNKIDIGLIENQSEHPDIILRPFMEDKLCAIVPPDSSLASKTSITLEELALHPFLMREKGSAGREILDAYFSLKDIHIHPLWESSSTQAIVQGVAMGLGVSVLPEMMIKKDILEHRVSYLSFPKPLKRNLNLILHRNKHLTKNMKSFIEYCMLYSEK